jgi:EAL and modified HD-GYP domain-containing signal transduction protein
LKNTYFARQPIMDTQRRTVGYELLYRNSVQNTFPGIDKNYATKRLLTDYFLGSHEILGNRLGVVNFPYDSLLDKTPELFPKDSLLIEIQEDCPPTDELLEVIKELSGKGYKIALDNFIPSPDWKEFLPYINLIRFDIQSVPIRKVTPFMYRLYRTKIKFLAEKVETYEEFIQAKQAGFHYFQGFFFAKPEMFAHKSIQPLRSSIVSLFQAIHKAEVDYYEIEELITRDVSLSYKLLRYVNSSSTVLAEITSFHQALAYLGEDRLKKFVSLVALSTIRDNKPDSLYSLSLQRAWLCQSLCTYLELHAIRNKAYIVGLFSLLDSLLDQPLADILETIPLDREISEALLELKGVLGTILNLVRSYERTEWERVDLLADDLGILPLAMKECYEDSIVWISEFYR